MGFATFGEGFAGGEKGGKKTTLSKNGFVKGNSP